MGGEESVIMDYPICYAANVRELRKLSEVSSGGVFFELAKMTLIHNGIVYGVAWKNAYEVEHIRVDKLDDLSKICRSKYLKSDVAKVFPLVREDLERGKKVLFSGTPCQISGLMKYLNREYERLVTVDVVCHGVPVEKAFHKYIQEKEEKYSARLLSMNFRDKRYGWRKTVVSEKYSDGRDIACDYRIHPLHSLYLKGINLRNGCGCCSYARIPRIGDISLGDFWGYSGRLIDKNEDGGISLLLINSPKGLKTIEEIDNNLVMEQIDYDLAINLGSRHLTNSPIQHASRDAFESLLNTTSFHTASLLCSFFGAVVEATSLITREDIDEAFVLRTFFDDVNEVIYKTHNKKLVGIITFGQFKDNYSNSELWVNNSFQSVCIDDPNIVLKIKNIFDGFAKINRIPVVNNRNELLYEVRRYAPDEEPNTERNLIIPFMKIYKERVKCFFYKRPSAILDFEYSYEQKVRMEKGESIDKCYQENRVEKILEDVEPTYNHGIIDDLFMLKPIIKRGRRYLHPDIYGKYLNVIEGGRRVDYIPSEYEYTIHIYGRCGVFGYAVADSDTLPSRLQKRVCNMGIRVMGHSTRGADNYQIMGNLLEDLIDGVIAKEDIIILYMGDLPIEDQMANMNIYIHDTTDGYFQELKKGNVNFYDIPGHMNSSGYDYIADYIYKDLMYDLLSQIQHAKHVKKMVSSIDGIDYLDEKQKEEIRYYTKSILDTMPTEYQVRGRVGAGCVNCNPFTKGHRYLIEKALEKVEVLFVFVVEEDLSELSFGDRYEMVRRGCCDLKNAFVFPSGRYLASIYTMPDYFYRGKEKSALIDMSEDVVIFARYIAPQLGIKYRFVGTEDQEDATWYYNENLKDILPKYGIDVVEIPRLMLKGIKVSAKAVRSAIVNNDMETIRELCPQSTVDYIMGHRVMKEM